MKESKFFEKDVALELEEEKINEKELRAFNDMIESWIERKLVSEENTKELISKMKEGKIDFFGAWKEMFELLENRIVALEKLEDEPNLSEKQRLDMHIKKEHVSDILGRLSRFRRLEKSKKKEVKQ